MCVRVGFVYIFALNIHSPIIKGAIETLTRDVDTEQWHIFLRVCWVRLFKYDKAVWKPRNVAFLDIISITRYNYIPENISFQEYYVFVSNAAAASGSRSAASQFRCQRDNFWRI